MPDLPVFQSLWATEQRRPGLPEAPLEERFDRVKAAGYDGMAIDLGAASMEAAREAVPHFARTGLGGLVVAFPPSIEGLRPALHLAKDVGAPFVVVIGQLMPLSLPGMVGVIRDWLRVGREEQVELQFETHRNCITNDLFTTLELLDAIPELRVAADLSHYLVDRELSYPIADDMQALVQRVLERADSFQGRIASREQVQVPLGFPHSLKWEAVFEDWWRRGFASWRRRHGEGAAPLFLCELGPPEYAITGADGRELSDRWLEALELRRRAMAIWAEVSAAGR